MEEEGQEDSDQLCSEEINDSALAFVGKDSITECITTRVGKLSLCTLLCISGMRIQTLCIFFNKE